MDKKDFYDNLYQFYFKNQSRVIGAVIGFIIGILILSIGFFKTLLLFYYLLDHLQKSGHLHLYEEELFHEGFLIDNPHLL